MSGLELEVEFLNASDFPSENCIICDEVLSACIKFNSTYQPGEVRPLQWWRQLYREFKWIIEVLRNQSIGMTLMPKDREDNIIISRTYRVMVFKKLSILENDLNSSFRTRFWLKPHTYFLAIAASSWIWLRLPKITFLSHGSLGFLVLMTYGRLLSLLPTSTDKRNRTVAGERASTVKSD